MIKEIQKRPFVRPLFIWIAGIVLQSFVSVGLYSFLLLLFPAVILLVSYLFGSRYQAESVYSGRWVWGMTFVSLLLFLSVQMTAYHENRTVRTSPNRLQEWAETMQQRLIEPFDRLSLSDSEKSVLAAITLGERQSMPKVVRTQFSVTGVAHILSVSGFHVAIVCSFLSMIFSFFCRGRMGKWVKYVLTVILLWIFTAITGLAASSVRAAVMLMLYLTGRQLSYRADGYNTLAAAAFCMLAYNPFYLFDTGFQLSYMAVWSILFLQPRLNNLLIVKNPLLSAPWGCVTVTLAAQAGVTFLCLYYFGYFSVVFLFTNLPLTLLATLLIPMALFWIFLPPSFFLSAWLQFCIEKLTCSMMWVVETFSRIPGSTVTFHFSFVMMLASYLSLSLSFIYFVNKRPLFLISSLFLLLIVLFLMLIDKYLHIRI
ncbi:MAG: ComEC/Rec2 family competence protein [Tannerellaceae bacterium]|jgi:competence protein ComEC|nr:ComEC/Rec2 family competence protein [Tannerellaceae bacterium]